MTVKCSVRALLAAVEKRYGTQAMREISAAGDRIEIQLRIEANQSEARECVAKAYALTKSFVLYDRATWLSLQERITQLFDEHQALMSEYEALP